MCCSNLSDNPKSIGYTVVYVETDNNNEQICIRHLVIEGMSQWVLGQNRIKNIT